MEKYFYVKWEDSEKKSYNVAFLAYVEGSYYFFYNRSEEEMKQANQSGFYEVPSFPNKKRIYMSQNDLFDFFKMRVPREPETNKDDSELDLLQTSKGEIPTDSFSIEEVPQEKVAVCKEIIQILEEQKEGKKDLSTEKSKE